MVGKLSGILLSLGKAFSEMQAINKDTSDNIDDSLQNYFHVYK